MWHAPGLGYNYHGPARRLSDFVTFMEARGAETTTTALAMKWVTLIGRQPSWSIHLTMTEVPPQDAVPPARRAKPYIYTDAEITALLAAALALPPANSLRRWTYHCLFGLIAVAGSEALDLRRDDVDLAAGRQIAAPIRAPGVLAAVATDRSAAAGTAQWSAGSRSSSPFRRPGPDQLVSCGRRCRAGTAGPLDLSRPRQCSRHLLVSIRRAGANDPCCATAG